MPTKRRTRKQKLCAAEYKRYKQRRKMKTKAVYRQHLVFQCDTSDKLTKAVCKQDIRGMSHHIHSQKLGGVVAITQNERTMDTLTKSKKLNALDLIQNHTNTILADATAAKQNNNSKVTKDEDNNSGKESLSENLNPSKDKDNENKKVATVNEDTDSPIHPTTC